MSRNKIIFLLGGLILVCITICVGINVMFRLLEQFSFKANDPAQAKQIGAKIADYVAPPNYREESGADMFFMQSVVLFPVDKHKPTISIMQMPLSNASQADLYRQMQKINQPRVDLGDVAFGVVGERQVKIRGETISMTIQEMRSKSTTLRQTLAYFRGKGGLAMIMFSGDKDTWDWDLVDRFLESMR